MSARARFAPSPTGSLHGGNALGTVLDRRAGDRLLLRTDDADAARDLPGGEEAILEDLRWLGLGWDDGPVRESDRGERYCGAPERVGGARFGRTTLLREDGTATYHLARVKAVGGDLRSVRLALTGAARGQELWTVLAALPREQTLRRLDAAL